jgi:hypothetical protein
VKGVEAVHFTMEYELTAHKTTVGKADGSEFNKK